MLANTMNSSNCLEFDGGVDQRLAEEYMSSVDQVKSRGMGSSMQQEAFGL